MYRRIEDTLKKMGDTLDEDAINHIVELSEGKFIVGLDEIHAREEAEKICMVQDHWGNCTFPDTHFKYQGTDYDFISKPLAQKLKSEYFESGKVIPKQFNKKM
ncbi:MAG: hypothetical protein AB7V77_01840 [Candidatus Woesearchaeota archaeon]